MIGMDFHEFVVPLTLSFIDSMAAHYLYSTVTSRFRWLPIKVSGGLDRAWIEQPYWASGCFEFRGLDDSVSSWSIR